jgi:hypothetical protein
MKYFAWGVLFLIALGVISITINTCNTATKMVNNGINTAYNQFKPEELLRKYEWFKDAAAQCDQKLATLKTYESRFEQLKTSYGEDSLRRRNWARTDQEQWNVWESEYTGIKASYNDLAAQYNAAMSKFNYAFCNAGQMPISNLEPLPREFKPYLTN